MRILYMRVPTYLSAFTDHRGIESYVVIYSDKGSFESSEAEVVPIFKKFLLREKVNEASRN